MIFQEVRSAKLWQNQAFRVAAVILFSLAVLRLTHVVAPMFNPPVNRLYAAVEGFFYGGRPPSLAEDVRKTPASSPRRELELAGQVEAIPELPPALEPSPEPMPLVGAQIPEPEPTFEIESAPEPKPEPEPEPSKDSSVDLQRIEMLRRELSECRIRRDEFYLQDDEVGYRREVRRMTDLVREIGDIEAEL